MKLTRAAWAGEVRQMVMTTGGGTVTLAADGCVGVVRVRCTAIELEIISHVSHLVSYETI